MRIRFLIHVLFFSAGILAAAGPARAVPKELTAAPGVGTCGAHADVTAGIQQGMKQPRLFAAAGMAGEIFEVFRAASGAWSIVMTPPDGETCLIATGQTWSTFPIAVPPGVGK